MRSQNIPLDLLMPRCSRSFQLMEGGTEVGGEDGGRSVVVVVVAAVFVVFQARNSIVRDAIDKKRMDANPARS